MSAYPEHDKLSAVSEQTQAAGEFLEWLQGQGVQLMVWRDDLTDTRPVDPACPARREREREHKPGCKPARPVDGPAPFDDLYAPGGVIYWMQHCTHWLGGGDCCLCEKGQVYEVTGIKSFVPEGRSISDLLAGCWDIDQDKIEAEKRAMLDSLRKAG